MSGIFTVLIALGLMQPAPDIDDRREQTMYSEDACRPAWTGADRTWFMRRPRQCGATEDTMTVAKEKLTIMFIWQNNPSSPLSRAAGELDLMRAEDEAELRRKP